MEHTETFAVDDALRELAERADSGEPEPYRQLLANLRARTLTADDVLALARSEKVALRRSAVALAATFADTELDKVIATLAADPSPLVRRALAEGMADAEW